jgi:hypothetical protein
MATNFELIITAQKISQVNELRQLFPDCGASFFARFDPPWHLHENAIDASFFTQRRKSLS